MKFRFFVCFLLVVSFLLAQSSGKVNIVQSDFEKSFVKVIEALNDDLSVIVTDNIIETNKYSLYTEKEVAVTFPAAIRTGYRYEVYPEYDYAAEYDIVTVYYFEADNKAKAQEMYNSVKTALQEIKNKKILGTWTFAEEKKNEDDFRVKMSNSNYPDLSISLKYDNSYIRGNQIVQLTFEMEFWYEY